MRLGYASLADNQATLGGTFQSRFGGEDETRLSALSLEGRRYLGDWTLSGAFEAASARVNAMDVFRLLDAGWLDRDLALSVWRMGWATWLSLAVKAARALWAVASGILHSSTRRVLRSTSTPTADWLLAPLIKSPSQWPGISRSSTSGGRTWMLTISGI